ncbi:hypothetical protein [Streptomyces paradoxus]|uniref:hypothetical protein n=1 Tax=Streptomyces paradoxus TaxID=66375 RepID=UPI0037D93819
MKAFRVGGTTDEITQCELCGRPELKGTVQMIELDADGNDFEDHYFGTACAAKAAGWTQKDVKAKARLANKAKREAADEARRKIEAEESARRNRAKEWWLREHFGTSDMHEAAKLAGMSAVRLSCAFIDEYEACQP